MNKEIGRNDPCPCGSGKKYKKCCGQPGMGKHSVQVMGGNANDLQKRIGGIMTQGGSLAGRVSQTIKTPVQPKAQEKPQEKD